MLNSYEFLRVVPLISLRTSTVYTVCDLTPTHFRVSKRTCKHVRVSNISQLPQMALAHSCGKQNNRL